VVLVDADLPVAGGDLALGGAGEFEGDLGDDVDCGPGVCRVELDPASSLLGDGRVDVLGLVRARRSSLGVFAAIRRP
jgi:hypothetical protein